ncbi:hypothetical protein IMCC20628_01848 [Hoeflea sp. IMCC20628]|uniref:DNA-binding protein n=1 Tax=Hoeflea sp. IMCC20628 TaxID=1620421 RepID=UPI00063BF62E|nr:DNA-binding protein [Hoeflea sp. IMCC20628]AKI00555.1 hypothetical protein IMCC20628_01848 [Hoeflea sp. IMCC20628]
MNMPTFFDRKEAARRLTEQGLKVSPATLGKWAVHGGGPVYQIFGNKAVYTEDALSAWAEAKLSTPRRSTSEVA